jgi:hypothetical protein
MTASSAVVTSAPAAVVIALAELGLIRAASSRVGSPARLRDMGVDDLPMPD